MIDTGKILREAQLTGILERICQNLELSKAQYETAKQRYEAISGWLAESSNPLFRKTSIYPQGSFALQTTVKPLDRDEYDVDLICLLPEYPVNASPEKLKQLVGDRLRVNGRYSKILEEKPRCWRINYAGEFHLDVTPSIPNPECSSGGELVPDKRLRSDKTLSRWKPSNPKGYQSWFNEHAAVQPTIRLYLAELAEARAQVEALPEQTRFKGILRRVVQLLKRHRDFWFMSRTPGLSPISVILTTLAAKSYLKCATSGTYETDLDFLIDVLRHLPSFVERMNDRYYVWNESTQGENFAEKWNHDSRLADAFFLWHRQALDDFESMIKISGLDILRQDLSRNFGESATSGAMGALTQNVTSARTRGELSVSPNVGLSVTSVGVTVRRNTFFGR